MSDQLPPLPPPKILLHYICFFWLVGWGASAIVIASHVGTPAPWLEWARALASQFFFGLLAFGFFYIQYVAVERVVGRELNLAFAHIQVLGGLALFLVGIVRDAAALILNAPQFGSSGLDSTLLFYICVLGEGMFLANVVVTYALPQGLATARPTPPVVRPAPQTRAVTSDLQKVAAQFDWSNSPAVLFAIAGAFFFVVGVVLVSVASTRVPILRDGAISYVSPGYLWIPLAIPFAAFAVVYWLIEIFTGRTFDRSATRIHFVCTILAVLESVRVYWAWSVTAANLHVALPAVTDFFGVFAFLALATGALVWNIFAGGGRTAQTAQSARAVRPA
jgi:hypothetical protein